MGTVHYMSPEQGLGRDVDGRSDIFSLGVVLYELTTGRLPFSGGSSTETIERIAHAQPDAIARFNYDAPPELERIIRRCLEKDPEDRYQTAKDLFNRTEASETGLRVGSGRCDSAPSGASHAVASAFESEPSYWSRRPSACFGSRAIRNGSTPSPCCPSRTGAADPDAEYFSDGVTESIISSLSKLPERQSDLSQFGVPLQGPDHQCGSRGPGAGCGSSRVGPHRATRRRALRECRARTYA